MIPALIFFLLIKAPFGSQTYAMSDTVFVSPNGKDQSPGSYYDPVQTLRRAIEISHTKNRKVISLKGGKYYDVSVKLSPADSGLRIVNYKNERPILIGGVRITKLVKENKFLIADIPGSSTREWDFRMLVVNGEQRDRARIPQSGYFQYANRWEQKNLPGTQGFWARQPNHQDRSMLLYKNNDLEGINLSNAEVTLFQEWLTSYSNFSTLEPSKKAAHLSIESTLPLGAFAAKDSKNNKYIVWNTREGLSRPGQWYLDRSLEKLVYWPRKNEEIQNLNILAPKNRSVIEFDSLGVKNITISGIEIQAGTNKLQAEEFSALGIDGAIIGDNLRDVRFIGITISNSGGSGIKVAGRGIEILNCNFQGLGASGIICKGHGQNKIKDCSISDFGLIFSSSVGIYAGAGTHITNCQVKIGPYSGICIAGDSVTVEASSIQNVMQQLRDGAAIYSSQHHAVIVKGNTILGNPRNEIGIYFDEKSDSCIAENNFIASCSRPIHCHLASQIDIKSNLFIVNDTCQLSVQKSSRIAFTNNVLVPLARTLEILNADFGSQTQELGTVILADSCFKFPNNRERILPILDCQSNPNGKANLEHTISSVKKARLQQLKNIKWPISTNTN